MKNHAVTFLVVDDHSTMRKVVKSNLNNMGFNNVLEASDGGDALVMLKENSIDYIISDWNMPRLNGFELLVHLRGERQYQDIPFMMVTAETDRDSVNDAVAAGVDEFLIKPFTPATLRDKVNRLMQRGRHQPNVTLHHKTLAGEQKEKTRPESGRKETILVVDDTPTNIDVISGVLSDDYRVLAATNGKIALKLAQAEPPPDLILLDIMMPEMDGMEVCRLLKDDPATENIPIIFLTAKTEVDDIAAGLDAGAVDYVTKPSHPRVLKARVRTHLSLKHAHDNLREQLDTLVENAHLREDVERMTRHDLKNPLTAIINTSESLLESKYLGGEQKEQIETVRKSSYTILGMIDRSMDLYKMETGQYKLNSESIDIVSITQSVVDDARVNAKEYGITVLFDAPDNCLVSAEQLLTFSMLGNLVKNAVEASPKKGNVSVSVSCDESVSISIHNQGVIPEEIRDNFFEKYVTSGKESGTGIGTYSARLMAEVQGGSIAFETTEAGGTTLTVTLPKGEKG